MSSVNSTDLEILLRYGTSGADPQVKIALRRLSTEVKKRLERGSSESFEFFASTAKAVARLKGPANAEARFDCLYDCGQFFYVGGYCEAALSITEPLKSMALASGNRALERKAYAYAGIVHNEVGDHASAVASHCRAFSIAREIGDDTARDRALINLGVCLMDCGLYREALPCFERVVDGHGDKELWSTAVTNMARLFFLMGEYTKALPLIKNAIELSPPSRDAIGAQKRTLREFTYVQIALELGRLNLARERASECARYARFGNTPRSVTLANIAVGLCEIQGGSVERGVLLLEATVERKGLETSLLLDALPALIKAYDAAGRIHEALQCLENLLKYVRISKMKGLEALVKSQDGIGLGGVGSEDGEALPLRLLEADLRAKVAEREAYNWRIEMFERMAATADLKEEASGEHAYRVGRLSALVAARLGWAPSQCHSFELAARLHDIGKIAMPDRILLSNEELKGAERRLIATHTTAGAELLGGSTDRQLKMAEEIARHHHEWWNGEGYPSKLKGKRIPIHARIVAVADVFDALTHGRPFSPPWPIDRAIDEIKARRGTQFDPEITDAFLELIEKLRAEHQDLDEYLGRAGRNSPFLQARNRIRQMLAEEREHEKMATVEGNATRH